MPWLAVWGSLPQNTVCRTACGCGFINTLYALYRLLTPSCRRSQIQLPGENDGEWRVNGSIEWVHACAGAVPAVTWRQGSSHASMHSRVVRYSSGRDLPRASMAWFVGSLPPCARLASTRATMICAHVLLLACLPLCYSLYLYVATQGVAVDKTGMTVRGSRAANM